LILSLEDSYFRELDENPYVTLPMMVTNFEGQLVRMRPGWKKTIHRTTPKVYDTVHQSHQGLRAHKPFQRDSIVRRWREVSDRRITGRMMQASVRSSDLSALSD
jgi:hypothetical protein